MEDFAGHERRTLQIEDGIHDVRHLTHVAHGMESAERLVNFERMHRRLDDTQRHCVHADAALGIFDREALGRRVEAALGERRQHRRHVRIGVVDQARRDLDDMAAALLLHRLDRVLGDEEKAIEVGREHLSILLLGVIGKRPRDEDTSVVDQRIHPAEAGESFLDDALAGFGIADVTSDGENVGIVRRLDRTRGSNDAIIALAEGRDRRRSNTLRCAGDDSDFLFHGHDKPQLFLRGGTTRSFLD